MNVQPFKRLISKLPPFSRLVKRREWIEALKLLGSSGRVRVEDRATIVDAHAQRLTVTGDYSPWKIGGTPGNVTVHPSFLRVPGRADCVIPTLGGISLLHGGSISGSGFVCIRIRLKHPSRLMNWIYRISGDAKLSASAQIHLREENSIEISGTPDIVITADTGTASELNPNAATATVGEYVIPLGHISARGIFQFINKPLQISLQAGFMQITEIDTE